MRGHAVVIGWLIVLVWVREAGAAPTASPYAG